MLVFFNVIIHNKEISRSEVPRIALPKAVRIGFVDLKNVINPNAYLRSKLFLQLVIVFYLTEFDI